MWHKPPQTFNPKWGLAGWSLPRIQECLLNNMTLSSYLFGLIVRNSQETKKKKKRVMLHFTFIYHIYDTMVYFKRLTLLFF
jgi:hypothetical protein